MDNRVAAKYLKLVLAIRAHEDKADAIREQAKALEEKLISNFQSSGLQRVTLDGHTLYLDRKLWASAGEGGTEALAAGLRAAGLEDLVSEAVNGQRLSAWVREADPNKDSAPEEVIARLPESVRPCIKVSEVYKLGIRKAS